jgi:SAM-dependent methyltransferase
LTQLRNFMLEKTYDYGYSTFNWHLRSELNWHRYQQIIDEVLTYSNQGLILDSGCGFGQISEMLHLRGAEVVGLDVGGVSNACKVWKHLSSSFIIGDGCKLPFPSEHFEIVVCCGALEHVYDERKFLLEAKRVLKKNGLFLCYYLPNITGFESLFSRISYTDHKFYDSKRIKRLFADCGYEVFAMKREHVIPELRFAPVQETYNKLHRFVTLLDDVLNKSPLRFFGDNWRIYGRKISDAS